MAVDRDEYASNRRDIQVGQSRLGSWDSSRGSKTHNFSGHDVLPAKRCGAEKHGVAARTAAWQIF